MHAVAVNASAIAVTVDGQSYSVPVSGFAAQSNSATSSSTAGRRLLQQSSHSRSLLPSGAASDSSMLKRRQLLADQPALFKIQLTINKCDNSLPVSNAKVGADLCARLPASCRPLCKTFCITHWILRVTACKDQAGSASAGECITLWLQCQKSTPGPSPQVPGQQHLHCFVGHEHSLSQPGGCVLKPSVPPFCITQ